MAVIGNNADTLLQGLSAFWLRYFRDIGDIQVTYEGTEILLGQSYLDLCSAVLNQSAMTVPLFNKDYYHLLTAREDQLTYEESGSGGGWLLKTARYGSLPRLQNKIHDPSAALEEGLDYEVRDREVFFSADPTDPPLVRYAQRPVETPCGGFFSDEGIADWAALGVQKGDTLEVSAPGQEVRAFTIALSQGADLILSVDTPAPLVPAGALPSKYSWKVIRIRTDAISVPGLPASTMLTGSFRPPGMISVYEVAFWAVDVKVDDGELYRTFGHLFGEARASSESYRSYITGLMQLYMLGPAIDRIESALNVVVGLPVVRDDGEVLLSYDNGVEALGDDGELSGLTFTSITADFQTTHVGSFLRLASAHSENEGVFRVKSITSAKTVVLESGVPFVTEAGVEWQLSREDRQRVVTSRGEYFFEQGIPLRDDVKSPSNFGTLELRAFEALTAAIQVVDHQKDPTWWHHILIPERLMPGVEERARQVSPDVLPLQFGEEAKWRYGDPYAVYTLPGQQTHVHSAAFELVDRFLKHHLFCVRVSAQVEGVQTAELLQILDEQKPAHTAVYFQTVA